MPLFRGDEGISRARTDRSMTDAVSRENRLDLLFPATYANSIGKSGSLLSCSRLSTPLRTTSPSGSTGRVTGFLAGANDAGKSRASAKALKRHPIGSTEVPRAIDSSVRRPGYLGRRRDAHPDDKQRQQCSELHRSLAAAPRDRFLTSKHGRRRKGSGRAGLGVKRLADGRGACQDGWTMTQMEDFIGTLHVIAAGNDPLDRQKEVVRDVLARFLRDSQQALGGDQERIRRWLESVRLELDKQALLLRTDRFADLRDHARELVADWLRQNPRL
jgi:hypothetical protein